MQNTEAPLIDTHMHIWKRDQPITDTAWHVPPTDAPIEECLQHLDDNGITFGVIAAASVLGDYYDYVRNALRAHKRLRATAILNPTTDIYQMERMRDEGFVGVRLMFSLSDKIPDITTGDYRLFLRRVADLGWHVHVIDKPERIAHTISVVENAGPRLVIDHMGHLQPPDGKNNPGFKAILEALDRGNTWVKLSGKFRFVPPESADQYAIELLKANGGDRLLWGSDWPFADYEGRVSYKGVLDDYYQLVPDPAMRRKIDQAGLRFYFT